MITFVIPAFNAETTISRTLDSLRAQTDAAWQAIVVDDGSSDRTSEIARQRIVSDARFRLIQQANHGASHARNSGLRHAEGEYVSFLDADDTVEPGYVGRMTARLQRHPGAEAVCCGSNRRSRAGSVIDQATPRDPAAACKATAPAPIHALLVSRSRLLQLGGFDERLKGYEDWDLWIRMVEAGVVIAVEPRVLATYWCTPGSLSRDGMMMIRDHAIVSERAKALTGPETLPREPDRQLSAVLWNGGVAIGAGKSWAPLVASTPKLTEPWVVAALHGPLIDGLCIGAERSRRELPAFWPHIMRSLAEFLEAVEAQAGLKGLSYLLIKTAEREVIRGASLTQSQAFGRTVAVPFASALRFGVEIPTRCDSVIFKLGRRLLETPCFGSLGPAEVRFLLPHLASQHVLRSAAGRLKAPSQVLEPIHQVLQPMARRLKPLLRRSDAAASQTATESEKALSSAASPPRLGREIILAETAATRERLSRLTRVAGEQRAEEPFGEEYAGDFKAWDAFFAQPDPWDYDKPYEQIKYDRTLAMLPEQPIARALELACAEGRFTERLAMRAEYIRAVDISKLALDRAAERCVCFKNIEYAVQDFFNDDLGSNWDLITCCEVLYYMTGTEQLEAFACRVHAALAPNGWFIQTHALVLDEDPSRSGFDWTVPFGAETIAKTFEATTGLRRAHTLRTELYRIDLFQRVAADETVVPSVEDEVLLGSDLEARVACYVVWNGAVRRRDDLWHKRAFEIPVLMYHRIADDGPPDLKQYRVSPADFERQLLFLRRRGFRSISVGEWRAGRRAGSLGGRPILLTFDDAYVDFTENAWPLLKRYDFSAHVFVPTDKVGGVADWDRCYGEPASIMSWNDIAGLAMEGVSFGSHLASHPWSPALPSEDLLREAVRSRVALETVLGREVTSVAPPYGATNARVDGVLRLAGYRDGFLDHGGPAQVWGLGLSTPRIEVRGGESLEIFAASLGVDIEPANERDSPPRLVYSPVP